MPSAESVPPPQLTDQVETMLGGPFFYDEERSMALYNDFDALASEELGARREIYIGTLRALANVRTDERSMAKPDDVREWNRSWQEQLTSQRLGTIVTGQRDFIFPLSRRLAILNRVEKSFEEGSAAEGLKDHQLPFLEQIVSGLQKASTRVTLPPWWPNQKDVYYSHGTTVNGPTGIGKTALWARLAKACGVGETLELSNSEWLGENPPVRMVGVTPTQAAIARLLGKTGSNLFGQLCPDVEVGGLYAKQQDFDADIVFASERMIAKHFADGKLAGRHVDLLGIDESHHLTGPVFAEVFLRHWEGTTIGFSATPAYSQNKDSRHLLGNEVKVKNVLDYAGKELSGIETYTILLHPQDFELTLDKLTDLSASELRDIRQSKVNETVRDFVLPLLAEGRKGIIFCEYGSNSQHAKDLAAFLNGLTLPGDRQLTAETLGNFQGTSDSPANRSLLSRYESGDVDIITTTAMGQEALHLHEVNFVIAACKVSSALRMFQIGGRGLSPSQRFDTCVFANINTVGFGAELWGAKTFEGVFTGRDIVHQGVVAQESTETEGKRRTRKRKGAKAEQPLFSAHIQALLDRADNKTMAEGLLGLNSQEAPVTEGYILSDDILRNVNIDRMRGWSQMARAGYRYEVRSGLKNGKIEALSYFEPAAASYFTDNPQPPKDGLPLISFRKFVARNEIITLAEIGEAVGLGTQYILKHYLTPEEREMAAQVRSGDSIGNALTWPHTNGKEIIKRLRGMLVCPEHLVIASAVASNLDAKKKTVLEYVRRSQEILGVEKLPRGKNQGLEIPAVPWVSAKMLAERYGASDPALFDYVIDDLPQDKNDRDPKKLRYAHQVQRQLGMTPDWVGSDE